MSRLAGLGLLAALSLAVGCGAAQSKGDAGDKDLVLRAYPARGQAEQLARAIGPLLILGEQRVGSARVGPDGQLLILAPRSVQEGVAQLIEAQSSSGEPGSPSSVVTTYWFLAARAGGPEVERAGLLHEIGPVLDEIDSAQGPQDYRLIERLELRQTEGFPSEAVSPKVRIEQEVESVSGGRITARVRAHLTNADRVETVVNLRAGQYLVLGQLALDPSLDPFLLPTGPPRGRDLLAAQRRPAETALYIILRGDTPPQK